MRTAGEQPLPCSRYSEDFLDNQKTIKGTFMASASEITVRPVAEPDEVRWRELFADYREFYKLPESREVVSRVWSWIHDPDRECFGLVAELDGKIVGIAHYRRFLRPSAGSVGIWLDDLFTSPEARGKGAGRALIARLQEIADTEGASVVRWITAEDNEQAQALYRTLAKRTNWVTYDAPPTSG
ncbi:MAG: GNAT family N-acetyltransferase [Microlunatus sp.]